MYDRVQVAFVSGFGQPALRERNEPGGDARADTYKAWQLRVLQEITELKRRMLLDHKMKMEQERGVGLRILLPCEQTETSEGRLRKELTKALRAHRDTITNVDHTQLTSEQRKDVVDAQARLGARLAVLRPIDRGRLLGRTRTET